jgi:hypothetical protein
MLLMVVRSLTQASLFTIECTTVSVALSPEHDAG